jgi:hypothetical protein
MTRAQIKDAVLSIVETHKLGLKDTTNERVTKRNHVSVFLTPPDRSAAFQIQISTSSFEGSAQVPLPTNYSQLRQLREYQPLHYEISLSCLREGESIATHSIVHYTILPTTFYPPLESQYIFVANDNDITVGRLRLDLDHTHEGMKITIRDPDESVFQAVEKSFKIQARPLSHENSLLAIVKRDDDYSDSRYAIFDDEEITFESGESSSRQARRSFLISGASTFQDHQHIFQFSRLMEKNPGVKNKHEARQFEVFLCVFDSVQERISWLMHTTTGGEISYSKAASPEIAWALHPSLPLLVWHIPGHRLRISNIASKESPITIAGTKYAPKALLQS